MMNYWQYAEYFDKETVMDDLDERLLGLLRLNARESVASLARDLKASRSTVQDRLARLEKSNVIKGYRLELDDKTDSHFIRAFVTVSVEPQKTSLIVAELKTFHNITSIHTVSGKFDLLVEVATKNTEIMDKILDRLGEIPGVKRTESSIVLSTRLNR